MNKKTLKYNDLLVIIAVLFVANILMPNSASAQARISKIDTSGAYDDSTATYAYYYVLDGMLDNKYESYYYNGKKKAEGEFFDNMRIGKWSVWDSTGKLCIQRVYSNAFDYKTIVPSIPDG